MWRRRYKQIFKSALVYLSVETKKTKDKTLEKKVLKDLTFE